MGWMTHWGGLFFMPENRRALPVLSPRGLSRIAHWPTLKREAASSARGRLLPITGRGPVARKLTRVTRRRDRSVRSRASAHFRSLYRKAVTRRQMEPKAR
jgi:hypothetical protein